MIKIKLSDLERDRFKNASPQKKQETFSPCVGERFLVHTKDLPYDTAFGDDDDTTVSGLRLR